MFKNINHQLVNWKDWLQNQPADSKIHIGCDSVVIGPFVEFYFVLAARHEQKGASFIYHKFQSDRFPDKRARLIREIEMSMEWLAFFRENGINVDFIEFDLNSEKGHFSETLVSFAKGWASAEDIASLVKPDEQVAVKAANHLCQ